MENKYGLTLASLDRNYFAIRSTRVPLLEAVEMMVEDMKMKAPENHLAFQTDIRSIHSFLITTDQLDNNQPLVIDIEKAKELKRKVHREQAARNRGEQSPKNKEAPSLMQLKKINSDKMKERIRENLEKDRLENLKITSTAPPQIQF